MDEMLKDAIQDGIQDGEINKKNSNKKLTTKNSLTKNSLTKNSLTKNSLTKKSSDALFVMPTKENYTTVFISNKYTIKQLKEITVHYKIKLMGASVKNEIIEKIYDYFKLYDKAALIQKIWRKYLFKRYNCLRGPARFKRTICVNETDFFTMDSLSEIPYNQFFSFLDKDNTIYGFDIMSIYNLLKNGDTIKNPYNRNPFPSTVKKNLMTLDRLSHLFKEPMNLDIHEGEEKNAIISVENRIITLFHEMEHLGNYTSHQWLLSLTHPDLMRFIYEINDIWNYRADLSELVKREICPDHRTLFTRMYLFNLRLATLTALREIAADIIGRLVRDGINQNSRCLGANFVLCALTLVNPDAAEALPWLYHSVM